MACATCVVSDSPVGLPLQSTGVTLSFLKFVHNESDAEQASQVWIRVSKGIHSLRLVRVRVFRVRYPR